MSTLTEVVTVCSTCGVPAPTDRPPYTWSLAVIDGRRIWTCGPCTRSQLFRIEARLPVT